MLHVLYNHKKFKEVQYNLINYSDLILLNNHKKQEQWKMCNVSANYSTI